MSHTPKVPPIAKPTAELPLNADDGTIAFDTSKEKTVVIKNNSVEDISGGDPSLVGTQSIVFLENGEIDLLQGDIPDSYKNNPVLGEKVNYVVIGSSCTKIGSRSFFFNSLGDTTSETFKLVIPPNVKEINIAAFNNATSGTAGLMEIELHEGLEKIGQSAFASNQRIAGEITIPDSVSTIERFAFSTMASASIPVSKFTLGSGIDTITERIFEGSHIQDIIIPDSITTIENSAFQSVQSITSLTIPNSVTSIDLAFGNCSATNINSYAVKGAFLSSSLTNSNITTIHARSTDSSWTAGVNQTIGGKSGIEVIKDLT